MCSHIFFILRLRVNDLTFSVMEIAMEEHGADVKVMAERVKAIQLNENSDNCNNNGNNFIIKRFYYLVNPVKTQIFNENLFQNKKLYRHPLVQ